ncbi:hypothetical protein FRC00_006565 [Tulasnella sp. 408]|nr:hypothetical protein FRC00_006565 [Tulasnella sp. 408]
MIEPDKEVCHDPQSVDCLTPLPVNSNPLENGISARKECLLGAETFGPQEYESLRLRFKHDNSSNSINDLPPEIIIQILDAVLDEPINVPYFYGGHYLSTLKNLAAVCRTWKSIIQSTPNFWAVIESTITPGEMEYMIHKSRNCALKFRRVHHYSAETSFLAFASLNMHRCSSLLIMVDYISKAAPLLKSPAPILREAIIYPTISDVNEPVVLFNGQAGLLEDLCLRETRIRWDLGLPPSLRRIRIAHKWAPPTWLPHPRTFVSALSTCAGLEIVELSGPVEPARPLEWMDLEVRGPIVELPMLKELKIENISIAGVFYIIGHLNSPALQQLDLAEFCQVDPVAHLLQSPCPLLLESIRRALASGESLCFTIGCNYFSLTIPGAGGHFHLGICCTDQDELVYWLVEEFVSELSSVREVELAVLPGYTESELQVLKKLMEAVNNVERLYCPYLNGVAADLLAKHLTFAYKANDGLHWHWPKLRNLELRDTSDWPDLAFQMFLIRYGASQVGSEKNTSSPSRPKRRHYPCRLTTLVLHELDHSHPEIFRAIARMVGRRALGSANPRLYVVGESGWNWT